MAWLAEWSYDDATVKGAAAPERAWVLSDMDVWYPNPFYTGPRVPHPEAPREELAAWEAEEAHWAAALEDPRAQVIVDDLALWDEDRELWESQVLASAA